MEKELGRELLPHEEVDHKDDNRHNHELNNLQILTGTGNRQKTAKTPNLYYFVCPTCGKEASILLSRYTDNQVKQNKAGPYCSRKCSGKTHN